MSEYDLTVLSLGAGTQSSALLMLAIEGKLPADIPPLDCAIFADTGGEPRAVYDWLEVLKREAKSAGIPLYHLEPERTLMEAATAMPSTPGDDRNTQRSLHCVPAYVAHDPYEKPGLARRTCTKDYKIVPIKRKIRELLGVKNPHGKKVLQLIGMSMDETIRMKPSPLAYLENRWPLIEMGWHRVDSINYLREIGLGTPPQSACVFCPFQDDERWQKVKDVPEDWALAVEFDERLRASAEAWRKHDGKGYPNMYVHRSGEPLASVKIRSKKAAGVVPLFGDECEGMCGA